MAIDLTKVEGLHIRAIWQNRMPEDDDSGLEYDIESYPVEKADAESQIQGRVPDCYAVYGHVPEQGQHLLILVGDEVSYDQAVADLEEFRRKQ